ncbi:MAG: FkbM family methyltransferase [Acidimicrobiia bacterium]
MTRFGPAVSLIVAEKLGVDQRLQARAGDAKVDAMRLGLRWRLDLASNHNRRLYALGSYDAPLLRTILTSIEQHDVFLDVGANVGLVAIPVAKRLRELGVGKVIAAEPSRDVVSQLVTNVALNGLEQWLDIKTVALGASPGSMTLRAGKVEADSGLRSLAGDGQAIAQVDVTTIDDLCSRLPSPPTIAKIDVEGWEVEVLSGATRLLSEFPPRLIIAEVIEEHLNRAGSSARDLHGILTGAGYQGNWIRHRGLQLIEDVRDHLSINIAYTRRAN